MTQPVSGGQLVVDCLVAQGVTTSFGVPGESYLHVLDGSLRGKRSASLCLLPQ